MAEDTTIVNDLDPKNIEDDLARLRQGQQPEDKPAETAIELEPKPAEQPKVIVQPEEKPAAVVEQPKPVVEAKKPEEAAQQREGTLRRLLREKERELKDRERELAEVRAGTKPAPVEEPKEPKYEDDPAEYLKKRQEETEQKLAATNTELAQERGRRQQQEQLAVISQQEQDFAKTHPDYWDARKHAEETEVREWERSGAAIAHVNSLAGAVAEGRRGNPAYKPYADHIDALAGRPEITKIAEEQSRDPEDIAMYIAARDTYLTSRRQLVLAGAAARGENPAAVAYELAQGRGYKRVEPKPEEHAREQVRRAREISTASESLSEVATSQSGTGPKVIRNRQQILDLDDNELDALIEDGGYKNL